MSKKHSDTAGDEWNGEQSGEGEGERRLSVGGNGDAVRVRDRNGSMVEFTEEDAQKAALMMLHQVNGRSVLLEAYQTAQERSEEYGPPGENFDAAARLMGGYADADLDGFDYAIEMILAKVARLQTGQRDRDTLVDIAGYARGAAVVEGMNDR